MSKSLDIAEAMATRLRSTAPISCMSVMVWKQQDLKSEIDRLVLRNGGMAIVILFLGFDNPDGAVTGQATTRRRYSVAILSQPIVSNVKNPPAVDAVELAARSLHNWDIESPTTGAAEINVVRCNLDPDADLLTYTLDIECLSRL